MTTPFARIFKHTKTGGQILAILDLSDDKEDYVVKIQARHPVDEAEMIYATVIIPEQAMDLILDKMSDQLATAIVDSGVEATNGKPHDKKIDTNVTINKNGDRVPCKEPPITIKF